MHKQKRNMLYEVDSLTKDFRYAAALESKWPRVCRRMKKKFREKLNTLRDKARRLEYSAVVRKIDKLPFMD